MNSRSVWVARLREIVVSAIIYSAIIFSMLYFLPSRRPWCEALKLMKVGSKWKLYIPPALGYGQRGSPPVIPPNSLLIFDIELLEIAEN